MVVFGVDPGTASGDPLLREVHAVISGDYVLTIHKGDFKPLDDLRKRYDGTPVRSEQFLVYKILDAITATFVPVLTRVDDDIDDIEQQILDNPDDGPLQRIFSLKKDLVAMRRVVTPMRDIFASDAERITELPGLQTDDRLYYRDLYDSLVRISELVDSYRDLLSGATDMYLSTVANRQGEIAKQLTVIATVFLPLSFLTGFFGQNFAFLTGHIQDSTWSFWVLGIGSLVACDRRLSLLLPAQALGLDSFGRAGRAAGRAIARVCPPWHRKLGAIRIWRVRAVYAIAGAGCSTRRGSSVSRAITSRWIWAVPSYSCRILASRISFSTLYSLMKP